MALHDLNRSSDTTGDGLTAIAKPTTNKLADITPVNWHRYPPRTAANTPAYVRTLAYSGGVYGDDIDTATATLKYEPALGEASSYSPRTQAEKATLLVPAGLLAVDVTVPRGWIDPKEPYGPPHVSPTDDPTISSLAPNTAVSNTSPIWVTITGTKFTQWSQVETGNVITPYSRYMSATKMAVLMDPRSSPGTVVVKVIDHGVKSAGSNFTFT